MGTSKTGASVYAIDFGTSNTVIARWNRATDEAEIINLPGLSTQITNNPPLIPSLVYVEDASIGKIILGQKIRDRGLDLKNSPRFFANFKRGIGATIQGFLPELDEVNITFERVGEWFLQAIIKELEADTPESLVLTVPVDSFESYRHWLTQVCNSWSIPEIRLLDEPTAVALGYGAVNEDVLLVVDFGGGTLDLSLVQLSGNREREKSAGLILKWGEKILGNNAKQQTKTARVIAKAGCNLGGTDIDNWLVNYFQQTINLPKSSLTTRLTERLKIQLSFQERASEAYFDDLNFESYQLDLDRNKFQEILEQEQFFTQLDNLMVQVLQQGRRNGIETINIDAVLLVGGTSQIPAVQNWLKNYFPQEKIRCDRPFDAIANGALKLVSSVEIQDFLYHSYGVRYWNRRTNRHDWHPLIKNGQPYPMNNPVELVLGASLNNQPSIELIIGELGQETGATEVYFDGDRLVTRSLDSGETVVQPLNDKDGSRTIAQLNPPGNPGSDRLKLQFRVDEQRFLRLTVEDLLTRETIMTEAVVTQLS